MGTRKGAEMANKLHLTVQTLSGPFEGDFEGDQELQDVIEEVFLTLDIKPAPDEKWELKYGDIVLNPESKIEEYKIPDGATLVFAPEEGGGGAK